MLSNKPVKNPLRTCFSRSIVRDIIAVVDRPLITETISHFKDHWSKNPRSLLQSYINRAVVRQVGGRVHVSQTPRQGYKPKCLTPTVKGLVW